MNLREYQARHHHLVPADPSDQCPKYIEERLTDVDHGGVFARDLFLDYLEWADGRYPSLTQAAFGRWMGQALFRKRVPAGQLYVGVALTSSE